MPEELGSLKPYELYSQLPEGAKKNIFSKLSLALLISVTF
jgi:hypothetical protein